MSHSWPKSESPVLDRHHFGLRIFIFGWRSSFLGMSVMQTTRLRQDLPAPNLLQQNCVRTLKKTGTKYEKDNSRDAIPSPLPPPHPLAPGCWHQIIPNSSGKQAPLAVLRSKKHTLPALVFSSPSLKAQLAGYRKT